MNLGFSDTQNQVEPGTVKTLERSGDTEREGKPLLHKAGGLPGKSQRHRHERRKVRAYLFHADRLTEEPE